MTTRDSDAPVEGSKHESAYPELDLSELEPPIPIEATRPTGSEAKGRGRNVRVVVVVGIQMILAAAASGGVWVLLDKTPTDRRLILLAGFAGVVGGSLGPLLRPLPKVDATDRSGTSLALSPLIYASAGFALAVGAYVLTSALLVDAGATAVNQIGVVAFGGIAGWIAAQIIDGVLSRPRAAGLSRFREERPAVVAALSELDERLFGRPLQNYDGFVLAAWFAAEQGSSLGGKFRVRFAPRVGPEESADFASKQWLATESPTAAASARVLVQGGVDVEEPLFSVSVIHRGLEAIPRRASVRAPVGRASETVEFNMLAVGSPRGRESPESAGDAAEHEDAGPLDAEERLDAALIEISQQGQTIQLLEMDIAPRDDDLASRQTP